MQHFVTAEEMVAIEKHTILEIGIPSLVLMEKAAMAVAERCLAKGQQNRVLCVCGRGNNGADGIACARLLHFKGIRVDILLSEEGRQTEENALQLSIARKYGIPVFTRCDMTAYTLIVDALLGIGLKREVSPYCAELIEQMNTSNTAIIAVDVPSGVSASTGKIMGTAVKAQETVTFAYKKLGTVLYPGAERAGKVLVEDIGIYAPKERDFTFCAMDLSESLSPRPAYSNKGTFGRALVIAGGMNMSGTAYLAGKAAYLAGSGLVELYTREENRIILQTLLPEAVLGTYAAGNPITEGFCLSLKRASVILLGPGLGRQEDTHTLLKEVLRNASCPVVIDADGLNVLSEDLTLLESCKAPLILTPHVLEMARLCGKQAAEVTEDLLETAKCFTEQYPVTLVLKDARSLICKAGRPLMINTSGNSGMACGGSGDVLGGLISGLCAQGTEPFTAAALGCYLHGSAGDLAAEALGEHSMTSGDLLRFLPEAFKQQGKV